MKKFYLALTLFFGCFYLAIGQVKIAELNFEIPSGYSTSIAEFTDGNRDYFLRTDGTDFNNGANGVLFNNIQGTYYFAAQDINGEGATLPVFLNIDDLDISGYENLEFRVHIAEDDQVTNSGTRTQHWDNGDYVRFRYEIDTNGQENLIWIENDGTGANNEPLIDTDFDGDGDGTAITDTFTQFTRNIASTGALLDIEIEFNLNGGQEDIAIDNIEIWGTFAPCSTTTTWTSTGWDNGTPDINTSAILDFDYNTDVDGSINACDLTINNGITLTINNNSFINIKNEINTVGDIVVEPQASVVQKNDASINTTTGTITVQKETTALNSPFEYTYWSSPVNGETIEDTFGLVPSFRRFFFDASSFEDLQAEVGNTGVYNPGQDDIDDNGDAWQQASGVMVAGVGYAVTPVPAGSFPSAPQQFTFIGPFNNGTYQPTLENSSGGVYNDWNFIGNPYPSAIDTNIFFTANAGIVDNIYLWNQATAADANAQGNEGQNYSGADYAVISASGVNTAGGDLSLIPNDFVPSGQGFFVEALTTGPITFNNSMRVTGNNDQFFRNTNSTTNRQVLWINLRSDNGVAKQIAIAHLDGASDLDDGTFYDVKRNASTLNFASLYTTIEGNENEFVIQCKSSSSLDIDEVIDLGFNSNIDTPTIFTIAIAQFEGDFYNENDIYLKDNLLNIIHNLKDSDYNFTSEIGTFTSRFEIIFNASVLSTNDNVIDSNELTITELTNGDVQVKVSSNVTITNVEILDILGRNVYSLSGNNSTETYNLSQLSKSAYIAKVTLSNGQIISKKAIKQK